MPLTVTCDDMHLLLLLLFLLLRLQLSRLQLWGINGVLNYFSRWLVVLWTEMGIQICKNTYYFGIRLKKYKIASEEAVWPVKCRVYVRWKKRDLDMPIYAPDFFQSLFYFDVIVISLLLYVKEVLHIQYLRRYLVPTNRNLSLGPSFACGGRWRCCCSSLTSVAAALASCSCLSWRSMFPAPTTSKI